MKPKISVIIVSDYGSGDEKGWNDLRETLAALAKQDYEGPVEYLLVESSAFASHVPPDLTDLLPGLKTAFFDVESSYALKNEGAKVALGEVLGVLDGDCAPDTGWVRGIWLEHLTSSRKLPSSVAGQSIAANRSPSASSAS